MRRTKRIAGGLAAAAVATAIAAAPAAAGNGKAYGKNIKADFGMSYGQLLNSVRGDTTVHNMEVFPPAAGAKAFYKIHGS